MPTPRAPMLGLIVTSVLSIASALISSYGLRAWALDSPAPAVLALLPVPFFVMFIIAELRVIQRADEFYRRVLLDSLAIAFPAALVLGVLVEGLQRAGVGRGWTIGDVWPWMGVLWVPALWISYRRYR